MDRRSSLETLEKRNATETKKIEDIKAQLKSRAKAKKKTSNNDKFLKYEVLDMASEFEAILSEYVGKPRRAFKNKIEPGTKQFINLARAVKFAKELDVDFHTYVKGLFYVTDKFWNRAPTYRDLADVNTKIPAKEKVKLYLKESKDSEDKKIVSAAREIVIPQAVKDRNSELQMKRFMDSYDMTEEEVLEYFGEGNGAFLYFDKDWLLGNETYIRLKEQGRI